jgi:tetratricopeptide (TPR) repeat protein
MSLVTASTDANDLAGLRIALVGRLAGMSKRDAQQFIRRHGGLVVEVFHRQKSEAASDAPTDSANDLAAPSISDCDVQLIVVGEDVAMSADPAAPPWLDQATQAAIEVGNVEVVGESEFWQRVGLVDDQSLVRRLYTPAMLAELLGVPIAVVRRWHRRGLIQPVREVRRLPYFDFQEVTSARQLAEMLAAGISPAAMERKLAELARYVPGAKRPLAQLSIIVRGSRLLLRQGDGLIGPGGQLFFDFDPPHPPSDNSADDVKSTTAPRQTISFAEALRSTESILSPEELLKLAADLEDDGNLAAAVEAYRAHAAAVGPTAPVNFAMAELLYRLGDIAAARERYYLGCVLAELGDRELAAAAFEGALSLHPEYADAHFHLARTLDELHRADEASRHWREFLRLAPESPWAAVARERLVDC